MRYNWSTRLPDGFAEAAQPVSICSESHVGVLVVHGITSTPGSMAYVTERFAQAGFNVETPLLAGHGTHWRDMRGVTWQDWVDSLREPLQKLQSRCSEVFLCGLSLGGGLIVPLAREVPGLSGMILINHLAVLKKDLSVRMAPLLHRIVRQIPNIAGDTKDPSVTEPAYPRLSTFGGNQAILLAKEVQKTLPHIVIPTIIFKSIEDHIIPVESAEYTYKKIGSADKEMVWLENSYHVVTMDYDKEFMMDKTLEWVSRHLRS